MITANVLQRVFHIQYGNSTGTAFTVDHESKQYLVSARHVVEGIRSGDALKILHQHEWKTFNVEVVGLGQGETDIAVLSSSLQMSPQIPLPADAGGIGFGQQVYFLGFPFGWDGAAEYINRDFPIPFVKSGVLSGILHGGVTMFYIDAHVNEGFSGGPLGFIPDGRPPSLHDKCKGAGVVANFPTPKLRPIVNQAGDQIYDQNGITVGIRENPGFVVAIGIKHAIDMIAQNPIGFPLEAQL